MEFKIGLNYETITFAIAVLGAIWKAFVTPRMSPDVLKWINKIGGEKKIMEFIIKAAEFASYTGSQKREWAYNEIQKWAVKTIGCTIPEQLLNSAIEFVLTKYNKSFK